MIPAKQTLKLQCICEGTLRKPRRYVVSGLASFSTSRSALLYSDTVSNLKINGQTRVMFQGFTGRQVG